MKKEDLETLKISDLQSESKYAIKNFIASNSDKDPINKHLSFDHPSSFEGVIFAICLKGEVKLKINFKEYIVDKNSIVTMLPGTIVDVQEETDDLFTEILAFSEEFIVDMPLPKDIEALKEIALNPVLKIEDDGMTHLLNQHAFIIETFNRRSNSSLLPELIKGLLYSLMVELSILYKENSSVKPKAKGRYEDISDRFLRLLFDNFREERSATFYADKLFVTSKHLSHVLKETTGKTINSWIDEAVTIGAKSLLKSTDYTVLQISEELNFPTASYFGRYFKRITGLTPLEYRES